MSVDVGRMSGSGTSVDDGRFHPRVVVGRDMDARLRPPGKQCARAGLPNLAGGMMRCHSMPGQALTCPNGWLAEKLERRKEQSRQRQETLRATSAHSFSLHEGSWSELHHTLRPSTTACERVPGGGRTQGARSMRPMTEGAITHDHYDPAKHGWHDPRGQLEQTRLSEPGNPRSHAWVTRKSRDHLGYGQGGSVGHGDVQGTAVSGDGPEWFVGTKTVPGPFSTKTVPVRRCPFVHIEGQTMRARGREYHQGDNMDIAETMHETNKIPERPRMKEKKDPMRKFNSAKYCSLIHGGCQTKLNPMPLSRHVISEGRTQRFE